jgi:site-specific DNA recombinase
MRSAKLMVRRCAVYTRKSSEEGLEQDFNSLHAQREACEAFIKSQKSEGWRLVEAGYDDGGLSGGNMDRPGLRRLLADIANRLVDTVVVYKVDRLTRSLEDFAKMVELFDRHGVSFVAVTQQFNTTTSMGRLTLNILLSFAQFEREVTGERIRDKIAASKRRGMWMGGNLPLGYDARERKLVINAKEANTVRLIYGLYRELGSVRRLKEELDRRGIRSKQRVSGEGKRSGGQPFSRGALYTLLANPVYVGETRHKSLRYPGQHEPLLDRVLWDSVQEQLRTQAPERRAEQGRAPSSFLKGKLFDENGGRLTPSYAVKRDRRYRYYVSQSLVAGAASDAPKGWRLPAPEIERIVVEEVARLLSDRSAIAGALTEAGIPATHIPAALEAGRALLGRLKSESQPDEILARVLHRVELHETSVCLTLSLMPLLSTKADGSHAAPIPSLSHELPIQLRRRGVEMRLVIDGSGSSPSRLDPILLKAVARAFRWFEALATRQARSVAELTAREGVNERYIRSLMHLAFLAPEVVEAITQGNQPAELTTKALLTRIDLPLDWPGQMQALAI